MTKQLFLDEYLDIAKQKRGLKSDRELAQYLGTSPSTVNAWRMKRQWPNDDIMADIANLAGEDPMRALLHLNCWRAKNSTTVARYHDILGWIDMLEDQLQSLRQKYERTSEGRAETTQQKAKTKRWAKSIGDTAAAALVASTIFAALPNDVMASTQNSNIETAKPADIYIMRFIYMRIAGP